MATTSKALDDVRELVREGCFRYGRERYGFEQRRPHLGSARGFSDEVWREFAELGWLALRLPEEFGGLNADASMTGSLMQTVGRHLLLEPVFASAVIGTGALLQGPADVLAELAPPLANGSLKLAFAFQGSDIEVRDGRLSGRKVGVLHGDVADQLIVTAGGPTPSLYLVDAASAQVKRQPYRLIDDRSAATIHFDGAAARMLGDHAACRQMLDEASVALCAESLGSIDYLVEATAAYLKVRKQFGRVIGSYQALQHRMSEMALLREEIRALTEAAQQALDTGASERARTISGAAAYIIGAARTIGNEAVQLHGGIGVTDELDISHHFRRLMVIASLLGGRDANLHRFADSTAGERA